MFPRLTDAELDRVARFGEPVSFRAGDIVAKVGDAGREPAAGIMDRELPAPCPSHRKAADGDALFVDAILLRRVR